MKSLALTFGGLLTAFVTLLCLCGHLADTTPIPDTVPPPTPASGQYVPAAKRPPVDSLRPAYRVTPSGRYSESGTLFPHADSRLPKFAPPPGYMFAISSASNRRGQIVGTLRLYRSGAYTVIQDHGFVWQQGRMHNLGSLPGYQISYAIAINDKGVIAGDAVADSFPADENIPSHAVYWVRGKIYDLGIGGATAIDDSGTIVGVSATGTADCPREPHALLWAHGYRYDLNDLIPNNSGWVLSEARAINAKGQITGNGKLNGKPHAFLLTPR